MPCRYMRRRFTSANGPVPCVVKIILTKLLYYHAIAKKYLALGLAIEENEDVITNLFEFAEHGGSTSNVMRRNPRMKPR
jgi:hypothetical protein